MASTKDTLRQTVVATAFDAVKAIKGATLIEELSNIQLRVKIDGREFTVKVRESAAKGETTPPEPTAKQIAERAAQVAAGNANPTTRQVRVRAPKPEAAPATKLTPAPKPTKGATSRRKPAGALVGTAGRNAKPTDEGDYACGHCDETFQTQAGLETHIEGAHTSPPPAFIPTTPEEFLDAVDGILAS